MGELRAKTTFLSKDDCQCLTLFRECEWAGEGCAPGQVPSLLPAQVYRYLEPDRYLVDRAPNPTEWKVGLAGQGGEGGRGCWAYLSPDPLSEAKMMTVFSYCPGEQKIPC